MPSPIDPMNHPAKQDDLHVCGALPLGLSGRLVGIGRDGLVHSLHFCRGRVSYLARSIGMGAAVEYLVTFDGAILAYGDDSTVRQLSLDAGTLHRVDLAGRGRTVAACPQLDPATGELHFIARVWAGAQLHHVVPAGALTRRNRLIADAGPRIKGLAVGRDHVVFVADGMAGVAPRDGDVRITWMHTDVAAPTPVHTHRVGDAILLLALTPSLERWTLHPDRCIVEREVLDATARRFAHLCEGGADGAPRRVWTSGDETIGSHDLVGSRHSHHNLVPRQPGDFVVVPDVARPDDIDSGWFVGLVHDPSTGTTDLRVSDATDVAVAIATIRLPRSIARGLRCTWVPATAATTTQHTPTTRTDGS
jgi:carotenoid cleavage dioxygenase-like enzyme